MRNFSKNYFYLSLLLGSFALCVWIALQWHGFWRGFFGDIVVMGIIFGLLSLIWRGHVWMRGMAVFGFAVGIEVAQYFNFIELFGLSDYKLARIVLGTAFDYLDILAYALGALGCVLLEKILFLKQT